MFRAAANCWQSGVDGLCTWFMPWPLGETERSVLVQLADPIQVQKADKHYFLRRAPAEARQIDYPATLPITIDPAADLGRFFDIPFTVADDLRDRDDSPTVRLRLSIRDLVVADRLEVRLNGQSLEGESVRRRPLDAMAPYAGQRLDIELRKQRPQSGSNGLQIALLERPQDLVSSLCIEAVEILVKYDTYPSAGMASRQVDP